ncbi:MAG: UbiA family prenyltransferase [Saprospiraceae bacterium]
MIKRLIDFYVFSNIHISIAALIFTTSSYSFCHEIINWHYILFITFGSFILYNIHRYIGLGKINEDFHKSRHLIFVKYKWTLIFLFIISIICGGISFFYLSLSHQKWLALPIILSLAYVIPSYKKKRLRDFPFLKIVVISIVWAWFFIIPLRFSSGWLSLMIFLEKAFFIFALTFPFDNRDREVDKATGLKTFANQISPEKGIKISMCFILIAFLFSLILWSVNIYSTAQFTALILFYIILSYLIKRSLEQKEFYYLAYLDGMIMLHGIALILTSQPLS